VTAESVGALVFTPENIVEVQPLGVSGACWTRSAREMRSPAAFALGFLRGWAAEECARAGRVIAA
jgi:hypothetical protein